MDSGRAKPARDRLRPSPIRPTPERKIFPSLDCPFATGVQFAGIDLQTEPELGGQGLIGLRPPETAYRATTSRWLRRMRPSSIRTAIAREQPSSGPCACPVSRLMTQLWSGQVTDRP